VSARLLDQRDGPALGILEWFRPGEHARVETAVADLERLGVRHLRTGVSWADYHRRGVAAWYDWLLPTLARHFEILPCVLYVPPSISRSKTTAGPPEDPKAYADFLDVLVDRHGRHFEAVELWNEPNNLADWDWRLDPQWRLFADMIIQAAHWMRRKGKRTVLGGMCPLDLNWLRLMAERGALVEIDVVGLHGFPGTWESASTSWRSWPEQVDAVGRLLAEHALEPALWITETGYSTWHFDALNQIDCLLATLDAPVERVYWYSYQDLHPSQPSQEGWHFDERHYHFGLVTAGGQPKLLYRVLAEGGIGLAREIHALQRKAPAIAGRARPAILTGGAGFLGCNLADRLAESGRDVLVVDSLARAGVEGNLAWLKRRHPQRVTAEIADIRDPYVINHLVHDASAIVHLAAQVAVTTSLADPITDFEVNALGSIHLLEALRNTSTPPPTLFASTNKVYGKLDGIELCEHADRYLPLEPVLRARGIGERQPLDLQSPYGCSKGAADQYVLDFARCYGLPTAVLRMSCLYGPHQLGTEDQGWVAHFALAALREQTLTIYGDGKQVRDILYVDDAVQAYLALLDHLPQLAGRAFNLGGGPRNAVSLLALLEHLGRLLGRPVDYEFADWRVGDQRYYVSDTSALEAATGWCARIGWQQGVARLLRWLERELVPVDAAIAPALERMPA
jgi:CDP-paratose 2-epimerase